MMQAVRSIRHSLIAAILLSTSVSAEAPSLQLTHQAIADMPAIVLAERLLGPGNGSDVERFEAFWGPDLLPRTLEVRLFHRPIPFDSDICVQQLDQVRLREIGPIDDPTPRDRRPLALASNRSIELVALAPGCRLAPDQRFAFVGGVDRVVAMQTLRDFAAVQAAASRAGRLHFRLSCRDLERRGACRRGARALLAALPIQRVGHVGENWIDELPGITVTIDLPGQPYWYVSIRDLGSPRARVSMVSQAPPVF